MAPISARALDRVNGLKLDWSSAADQPNSARPGLDQTAHGDRAETPCFEVRPPMD